MVHVCRVRGGRVVVFINVACGVRLGGERVREWVGEDCARVRAGRRARTGQCQRSLSPCPSLNSLVIPLHDPRRARRELGISEHGHALSPAHGHAAERQLALLLLLLLMCRV